MADKSIKKVIIQKSQLPPISGTLESYVVRFRVISEDRNRISHWSPQFFVSPTPLVAEKLKNVDIEVLSDSIVASWSDVDEAELYGVDVFVAWGSAPGAVGLHSYYATIVGNTVSIPRPPGAASVQVRVQLMVFPRKLLASRLVAENSDPVNLV
jgi:hypothetical protein